MDGLQSNTVGQILKKAREDKGASISDVAAEIMVPQHYLLAIEEDRYKDLPGQTYAIGFVRNYSRYLCLPSSDIVEHLKSQVDFPKTLNTEEIVSGFVAPPKQNVLPSGASVAAGLCVAIGVYGLWFAASSAESTAALPAALPDVAVAPTAAVPSMSETVTLRENIASVQPAMAGAQAQTPAALEDAVIAEVDIAPAIVAAAKKPTSAAEAMVNETVNIHVAEESWVEIRTEGKIYFSGIKKPGDVLSVPGDTAAISQLTTGNAGGVWVSVGAWTSQTLGESGGVRRNLALAPQQLISMLAAADRS